MEVMEIQIELKDDLVHFYRQASQSTQIKLRKGMAFWLQHALRNLSSEVKKDPWLDFLAHIQDHAVDTGIEDLSINHEYYLYGGPKRV